MAVVEAMVVAVSPVQTLCAMHNDDVQVDVVNAWMFLAIFTHSFFFLSSSFIRRLFSFTLYRYNARGGL